MEHLLEPNAGQILYHYTTADSAEAILRSNSLRLSEFSMMNDKSEYTFAKMKFWEAYENRKVWIEDVPRLIVKTKLQSHEAATTMMIGCLTQDGDDAGLWDRYADKGKGCVLGLNAIWLAESSGIAIRRISYDVDYLSEFVNTGLLMMQSEYEENQDDRKKLEDLAGMFVMDLYAFKDPRFRSEKEVRISRLTVSDNTSPFGLYDPGGCSSDGTDVPALPIQQRQGSYGYTRFVDLPLWDDCLNSAIVSVGFGPNIDSEDEANIIGVATANPELDYYKSDLPLR